MPTIPGIAVSTRSVGNLPQVKSVNPRIAEAGGALAHGIGKVSDSLFSIGMQQAERDTQQRAEDAALHGGHAGDMSKRVRDAQRRFEVESLVTQHQNEYLDAYYGAKDENGVRQEGLKMRDGEITGDLVKLGRKQMESEGYHALDADAKVMYARQMEAVRRRYETAGVEHDNTWQRNERIKSINLFTQTEMEGLSAIDLGADQEWTQELDRSSLRIAAAQAMTRISADGKAKAENGQEPDETDFNNPHDKKVFAQVVKDTRNAAARARCDAYAKSVAARLYEEDPAAAEEALKAYENFSTEFLDPKSESARAAEVNVAKFKGELERVKQRVHDKADAETEDRFNTDLAKLLKDDNLTADTYADLCERTADNYHDLESPRHEAAKRDMAKRLRESVKREAAAADAAKDKNARKEQDARATDIEYQLMEIDRMAAAPNTKSEELTAAHTAMLENFAALASAQAIRPEQYRELRGLILKQQETFDREACDLFFRFFPADVKRDASGELPEATSKNGSAEVLQTERGDKVTRADLTTFYRAYKAAVFAPTVKPERRREVAEKAMSAIRQEVARRKFSDVTEDVSQLVRLADEAVAAQQAYYNITRAERQEKETPPRPGPWKRQGQEREDLDGSDD